MSTKKNKRKKELPIKNVRIFHESNAHFMIYQLKLSFRHTLIKWFIVTKTIYKLLQI